MYIPTHIQTCTHTHSHIYTANVNVAVYCPIYCRCGNTLQHTATHCNTLQHSATHCNTLRDTATYTATYYNTLQHQSTPTSSPPRPPPHAHTCMTVICVNVLCVHTLFIQGDVESQDALSPWAISRKRALKLVALLQKNDLQLKASYESSPSCMQYACTYPFSYACTHPSSYACTHPSSYACTYAICVHAPTFPRNPPAHTNAHTSAPTQTQT